MTNSNFQGIGPIGEQMTPQALLQADRLSIPDIRVRTANITAGRRLEPPTELPHVGYAKKIRVYLDADLVVTSAGGAGTANMGNPHNLLSEIAFRLQSTVAPYTLDGVSNNAVNRADDKVIPPKYDGPARGDSLAAGTHHLHLEHEIVQTVSEYNLLGAFYIAENSTYPVCDLSFGDPSDLATAVGDAVLTLENGTAEVWMEYIEEQRPIPPTLDPESGAVLTPGQGLWAESAYVKHVSIIANEYYTSTSQPIRLQLPRGPIYSRIHLLAFDTNGLDSDDSMLSEASIWINNNHQYKLANVARFDQDWREFIGSQRQPGQYLWTFSDKTSGDRDLFHTESFGRLELRILPTSETPGDGYHFRVITETLEPFVI